MSREVARVWVRGPGLACLGECTGKWSLTHGIMDTGMCVCVCVIFGPFLLFEMDLGDLMNAQWNLLGV